MNPETPITDALWERLSIQGWTRGLLPVSTVMESHEQLERELSAERALADRLAEALNESTEGFGDRMSCEESCQCAGRRIVGVNKKALTAWKEARRE